MPNTNLPTSVANNALGHLGHAQTIHAEINELSRRTTVRNITGLLLNGWTAEYVHIERIRDRVYLRAKGLNGTNATSSRVLDFTGSVGTGFSPPDQVESPALRASNDTYPVRFSVSLSGGVSVGTGHNLGSGSVREFSWYCKASWPTTEPGTLVQ